MTNKTLIVAARLILKELVMQCTDEQQHFFKQIYSSADVTLDIRDVADTMDPKNIEIAITQCENTILSNKKRWPKLEQKQ